ncbi:terminase gpA endonuclease subunit, partial [Seohaeicola nanhaiensis]
SRVIIVKGGKSANGPVMVPQQLDRRPDGAPKRRQKRAWMLNVSQLKADFYTWLAKEDPLERGYCDFPRGMGDEYYRQVTSEVRVLKRDRYGVMTSSWELVETTRRNEGLDTMNYAEAAARRKGWASLTAEQWAIFEAERGAAPAEPQPDLFDQTVVVAPTEQKPAASPAEKQKTKSGGSDWLGARAKKGSWF